MSSNGPSCEENHPPQNGTSDNSSKINAPKHPPFLIMDDEQQYESASIIYGPGLSWTASPSPLHQATQGGYQYPPYVGYYPDYQNGGK